MRHRANQRTTHLMTVRRRVETGTDDFGETQYGREVVIEDEPVRFTPAGTEYVREDGGERVRRSPSVRGRGSLVGDVQEGDLIELTPKKQPDDTDGATYEASAVDGEYGGRASGPVATTIQLEGVA